MQTLTIDTNGIVKILKQGGFSRTQAEGITAGLQELDTATLVTKSDLEIGLANQTVTIIKWVTCILPAQGALIIALIQYCKQSPPRPLDAKPPTRNWAHQQKLLDLASSFSSHRQRGLALFL